MQGEELYQRRREALSHWIYTVVPRHNSQIYWFDLPHWFTWALLGNDDDGLFGEEPTADYKPEQAISGWKAARWAVRNPFHNLFFYVIGQAYRDPAGFVILSLSEEGVDFLDYRPKGGEVFAGSGGSSFYFGLHGFLPFLSFRVNHVRQTNFYLGWRERGNFGLKAQLAKKYKRKPAPLLEELVVELD